VDRGGRDGQKRAKVGDMTPRSPRRVATAASTGGVLRKSDRLKGKCSFSTPGGGSGSGAGVDAGDPIPLSDEEGAGVGRGGGGLNEEEEGHRGLRGTE
jgi:hypothetical protein